MFYKWNFTGLDVYTCIWFSITGTLEYTVVGLSDVTPEKTGSILDILYAALLCTISIHFDHTNFVVLMEISLFSACFTVHKLVP